MCCVLRFPPLSLYSHKCSCERSRLAAEIAAGVNYPRRRGAMAEEPKESVSSCLLESVVSRGGFKSFFGRRVARLLLRKNLTVKGDENHVGA